MIEILNSKQISDNDLIDLSKLFAELIDGNQNFENMKKNFEIVRKDPLYHLLCAKMNDKIVGSLMGIICHDLVGECKPFMVIENVIVSQKYRRCNIGKKLMSAIEEIGRATDCYYVIFVSGSNRNEAHSFYASVGYDLNSAQGFKKFLN